MASAVPAWVRPCPGGVLLDVVVQPRASRTRLAGEHGGRLKIQLAAPPVDGEANDELCRHLGSILGLPRRDVEIHGGATSRRKTVRALGVTCETAAGVLASKAP